jgi:hypothetical protein
MNLLTKVGRHIPDSFFHNPLTKPVTSVLGPIWITQFCKLSSNVRYDGQQNAVVYDTDTDDGKSDAYFLYGAALGMLFLPVSFILNIYYAIEAYSTLYDISYIGFLIIIGALGTWLNDVELESGVVLQ